MNKLLYKGIVWKSILVNIIPLMLMPIAMVLILDEKPIGDGKMIYIMSVYYYIISIIPYMLIKLTYRIKKVILTKLMLFAATFIHLIIYLSILLKKISWANEISLSGVLWDFALGFFFITNLIFSILAYRSNGECS